MTILTIPLTETIDALLRAEAKNQNVDPATLCSGIIVEHLLRATRRVPLVSGAADQGSGASPALKSAGLLQKFDVRSRFSNYPTRSIELAQQFVNNALEMAGTRAFPSDRGIGFEPNFVFIEYMLKRQPGGIGVSFYGSPTRLQHLSGLQGGALSVGRNPNYSRAVARTQQDLMPLLKLIRHSYELKR